MGNSGARRLKDYPQAMIEVACDKRGRRGRVSRDRLLAKHDDVAMPDLLKLIAADCPRIGSEWHDRCAVYYPRRGGSGREGK